MKGGKTFFEVYVLVRDENGRKIQRRRRGLTSKRQAHQVEFELRREVDAIANQEPPRTWSAWLEECLRRMRMELKKSTVETYETRLRKWANPFWARKPLTEITQQDVRELIFNEAKLNLTPTSRRSLLKEMRRIFQMAVEEGILTRNPATGVRVKVPEPEKRVLSNEEAQMLLRIAKQSDHPFYLVWAVALMTGMRSGELFALKWRNVDLEGRKIHVVEQWTSKDGFGPTKTRKNRIVPVSDSLLKFLRELRAKTIGSVDIEFVLPRLKEWEHGEQARMTRAFCQMIGVQEVAFHDLRATFITNLLGRGESLARVMAIVGHAEIKTTNIYLRLAGVDIKDGTQKLGYRIPEDNQKVLSLVKDERKV